jgi:hypothetical protein
MTWNHHMTIFLTKMEGSLLKSSIAMLSYYFMVIIVLNYNLPVCCVLSYRVVWWCIPLLLVIFLQVVYNAKKLSSLVAKKKKQQNWLDYYENKYSRNQTTRPTKKVCHFQQSNLYEHQIFFCFSISSVSFSSLLQYVILVANIMLADWLFRSMW